MKAKLIAEIKDAVKTQGATKAVAVLCRNAYLDGTLTLDEINNTVSEAQGTRRIK